MFGSLASCEWQKGDKHRSNVPEGAGRPPPHSATCDEIFYSSHGMILKTLHETRALNMQNCTAAGRKLALQCALVLIWLNCGHLIRHVSEKRRCLGPCIGVARRHNTTSGSSSKVTHARRNHYEPETRGKSWFGPAPEYVCRGVRVCFCTETAPDITWWSCLLPVCSSPFRRYMCLQHKQQATS